MEVDSTALTAGPTAAATYTNGHPTDARSPDTQLQTHRVTCGNLVGKGRMGLPSSASSTSDPRRQGPQINTQKKARYPLPDPALPLPPLTAAPSPTQLSPPLLDMQPPPRSSSPTPLDSCPPHTAPRPAVPLPWCTGPKAEQGHCPPMGKLLWIQNPRGPGRAGRQDG